MIYVCPLAHLIATVEASGARHVITVMGRLDKVPRPPSIAPQNHLMVSMDDIAEPTDGFSAPARHQVADILAFVRRWDRAAPLVIHCFAGISRSTATAFAALCALKPESDEAELARALRAASPTAIPNSLIVAHADDLLARQGRMVKAAADLSSGQPALEARPFRLPLDVAP